MVPGGSSIGQIDFHSWRRKQAQETWELSPGARGGGRDRAGPVDGEVSERRGPSLSPAALTPPPALCFMTCFMSTAWRLPRCHGNQPGADSQQLHLGLAILSQELLLGGWGGNQRLGSMEPRGCVVPACFSALLQLLRGPGAQEPCGWEIVGPLKSGR